MIAKSNDLTPKRVPGQSPLGSLGLQGQGVPPSLGQDSHALNQVQADLDQQSPPDPGHHLRQGEL